MEFCALSKAKGMNIIMSKKDICEKLYVIIKQVLEEEGKLPASFDDNLSDKLDSIEFVMVIVEIENQFRIKIDDDDFEIANIASIDKLADLVIRYMH